MASDLPQDDGLPKNPNLEHAELLYVLQNKSVSDQEKQDAKTKLMKEIAEHSKFLRLIVCLTS